MTTTEHPITPPPDLVEQWAIMLEHFSDAEVFTQVARWGANQELEACCEWTYRQFKLGLQWSKDLRAARRPKPPSLKEQALMALEDGDLGPGASLTPVEVCIIRRALEQLDD